MRSDTTLVPARDPALAAPRADRADAGRRAAAGRHRSWYVGWLKEVPNVMSQGETLVELEENIRHAYRMLMMAEPPPATSAVQTREVEI